MICGSGRTVGNVITSHPDVAGVTFTGSQPVGHRIATNCVERHAKVQLEMGGKNPLVVIDDADLDNAVNCAVNGAYFSTGQRCTASSRLIVTEGIHDRFVEGVIDAIRNLKVGHALESDTKIGPVVSEDQLSQNLEYIEIGKNEGATLAWGGDRVTCETEGYFQAPALFTETTPAMRINTEEIFGPVATVIRVKDYEEALSVANDTEFGLSTGICTTSLKYARDFQKRADAGMVMINLPTAGVDYHVPFGGKKGSSYGSREQGSYAAEFYTNVKTTYIHS
jgi:aldehyde dehydrogenase (NAD+)